MPLLPLPYLLLFLIFETIGLLAFFYMGKEELFFFINGSWGKLADVFWFVCTSLGEWPMIVMVILLFYLYKRERIPAVLIAFSLNGILAWFLKMWVFKDALRPAAFFKDQDTSLFVSPYLETAFRHSFPSGHTFTAFVGFTLLAFAFRKKHLPWICFSLALLAGISRIYNGFHFPEDVLAGAFLGVLISGLIYTFVPPLKGKAAQTV